jgi:hypothetical protein
MRKLRLGSITKGKLRNDLQESCGLYEDSGIANGMWDTNLNEAVSFLYEVFGWKNLPDYRDIVPIPIIKTVYANAVTGSAYNHSSFQLTVPAGATWGNAAGFDNSWIGATGTITDTTPHGTFNVTIIAVIDANNAILQPGSAIANDISAAHLIVNITTAVNSNGDDIDLTLYPLYKQIDKIEKITFQISNISRNAVTKLAVGGENAQGIVKITSSMFESIKSAIQQANAAGTVFSNYPDQQIWYRQGETLRMARGENIAAYYSRMMYVVLKPALMVLDTDLSDIPDDQIPVLKRFTRISTLAPIASKLGIQISQDDLSWFAELQQLKAGAIEKKKSDV